MIANRRIDANRAPRSGSQGGLALAGVALVALMAAPGLLARDDAGRVVDYLERLRHETGAPGISAAVAVGGELVASEAVGFAELEHRTPASGASVYNIGSVSKVMAAVAVMQLVETGKVSLDARIQEYVPAFPDKGPPITVRHILTHTSGIRHYKDGEFGPYGLREMQRFETIAEAMEHFSGDPLLFEPSEFWSYSSHAFNLLQGVVETASGLRFEDYMTTRVWMPAGMLSTAFDVPERIVHRRARGYERDPAGRLINTRYVDVSYKYAGGGMIASVEDLVRFGMALNVGTLLTPETLSQMYAVQVDPVRVFQPGAEPEVATFKQALAWRVETDMRGRPFVSHTGTVKGTRTALVNYREHGVVVAMAANILPFDSLRHAVAIAQLYLPAGARGSQ